MQLIVAESAMNAWGVISPFLGAGTNELGRPIHVEVRQQAGTDAAAAGERRVLLAADHQLTIDAFAALTQRRAAGLVCFDAHLGVKGAVHARYLNMLLAKGIKQDSIIHIGCRERSSEALALFAGIRQYPMHDISSEGMHELCDAAMASCRRFEALYLSIDLDVVDPSMAPGVKFPCAAGMTSRELLYFVQRYSFLQNLRCIDLVEHDLSRDKGELTAGLMAKLIEACC